MFQPAAFAQLQPGSDSSVTPIDTGSLPQSLYPEHLYYTIDSNLLNDNLIDINALREVNWKPVTDPKVLSTRENTDQWLFFQLQNSTDSYNKIIIKHDYPWNRALKLIVFDEKSINHIYDLGEEKPISNRPIIDRNFLIPIDIEPNGVINVAIISKNPQAISRSTTILTTEKFASQVDMNEWFHWFWFGILFLVASYNLILYAIFKNRTYLVFVSFIIISLANAFLINQYGYYLFWGDIPGLDKHLIRVSNLLVLCFSCYLTIAYLQIDKLLPKSNLALQIIATLSGLGAAVMIVVPELSSQIHFVFFLLQYPTYMLILYTCYCAWNRSIYTANIIFIGWAIYFAGNLATVFISTVLNSLFFVTLLEISRLLQLLLFSFALSMKVQEAKKGEEIAIAKNREKSEFLAKMTHEIRTPMSGILGMSTLLDETGLNSTQQKYNRVIQSSMEALLHIINEVLDLSKIEAGKMELEETSIDLEKLTNDCLAIFKISCIKKGIALYGDTPPFKHTYKGDPLRLRQIIINLLNNATKFTSEGSVTLEVIEQADRVIFKVRDTGIGIPKDKVESMFSQYQQQKQSTAREYGGSGLGLSITKQLVDLMGGSIEINSQVNKGTICTVNLPLICESIKERPSQLIDSALLICMDSTLNYLLEKNANNYVKTFEIIESLDILTDSVQAGLIDHYQYIVIYDEKGMGLESLLRLIPTTLHHKTIAMAACTPKILDHITQTFGVAAIEAPSTAADFFKLLNHDSNSDNHKPSMFEADNVLTIKPLKILLAEDNEVNQNILSSFLKTLGHDVALANNGEEACEQFKAAHQGNNPFDFVFMDYEMPVKNGVSTTTEIRNYERSENFTKQTPIIALTAYAIQEVIDKCKAAGMNDFLSKPVKRDELQKIISDNLNI